MAGKGLPAVRLHGDFHPFNVLCDPKTGEIRYIIDWDSSERPGLPAHDMLSFLVSMERYRQNLPMGRAITRAVEGRLFGELANETLHRYSAELSIPADLLQVLVLSHWLRLVVNHIEHSGGRMAPAVKRNLVIEPSERFAEILR
jgi:aminoglycoside phosphotransferase (APT) family kinase protein